MFESILVIGLCLVGLYIAYLNDSEFETDIED